MKYARALLAVWVTGMASNAVFAQADQPVRGGTLVIPIHFSEPKSFDCASAGAGELFRIAPHYSLLMRADAEQYPAVRGELAKSWTVSADGLRYEFTLHPNVKFHDGTPLTANDVKVSFDRLRHPPPGVVSTRRAMFEDISTIEAPDAQTLVIHMSQPNAAMLQLLAMPYACVYSAKLLAADPTYPGKKVMGSGPFKFERFAAGTEWVGTRFDDYFEPGKPYLDGYRTVSVSPASAINAAMAGQVHYTLRALTATEVSRIKQARGDAVKIVGQSAVTPVRIWVAVNTTKAPLNDVRVRRALTLAVDRWAGARAMAGMTGLNVVGGLVRPGQPLARSSTALEKEIGFGRDIAQARKEARRLLAEAGHPDLKLTMLNTPNYSYVGVFLADQLRQIGVTMDHQVIDAHQLHARRRAGDFELVYDSPPEYMDDPTVQFSSFTSFKDNPSNTTRVNDEKFDALYESQKREIDPLKRRAIVHELESYVLNQAYVLPLFWQNWTRAVSSEVGGISDMSSNFLKMELSDVWLRSPRAVAQQ